MKTVKSNSDAMKTHNGPTLRRDPLPKLTGAEREKRTKERAEAAAAALADHEEREKAKRANMERLKAERLARGPINKS